MPASGSARGVESDVAGWVRRNHPGAHAWLDRDLARWELYEIQEGSEQIDELDAMDQGNLKMRFVQAFNPEAAVERAREGLDHIFRLLPSGMESRVTVTAHGADEIAVSLHGLEFARVRQGFVANSFARQANVTFGAGANQTRCGRRPRRDFSFLVQRLFESRYPAGSARNPLFRLQPEAWLESTLAGGLAQIDAALGEHPIYRQVPAFAAADRAMLDLLTATRGGRLAILELKAAEDLHFPLQGLDYWIRVHWLHQQRDARGSLRVGEERILSGNAATTRGANLVLHRSCSPRASVDGGCAAVSVSGHPLDSDCVERKLADGAQSDLSQARQRSRVANASQAKLQTEQATAMGAPYPGFPVEFSGSHSLHVAFL